jgi:hypothetical protein
LIAALAMIGATFFAGFAPGGKEVDQHRFARA